MKKNKAKKKSYLLIVNIKNGVSVIIVGLGRDLKTLKKTKKNIQMKISGILGECVAVYVWMWIIFPMVYLSITYHRQLGIAAKVHITCLGGTMFFQGNLPESFKSRALRVKEELYSIISWSLLETIISTSLLVEEWFPYCKDCSVISLAPSVHVMWLLKWSLPFSRTPISSA